jgi:SAM-dependent methyltransferase
MKPIRLNLGCGPAAMEGFVNVDWVAWPGVDVIADLDKPWPFDDSSAEFVLASHVFEHLDNPVHFMTEAWRVLGTSGVLQVCVPYFKHQNSFADPTHKRHCTEHTFDYWIDGAPYHIQYGAGYQSPPVLFKALRMEFGRYEKEIIPNEMRIFLGKLGGLVPD